MRPKILLLGWMLGAAWSLPAGAAVSVTFEHPERYSDAALRGAGHDARDAVLRDLRRHLETLGDRYLATGRTLHIVVLDIDLAGRQEPWRRHAADLRILNGVTWPRIRLRYVLEANGDTLAAAEESLADQNYLQHAASRLAHDRLRYEKAMLEDWFRMRFRS